MTRLSGSITAPQSGCEFPGWPAPGEVHLWIGRVKADASPKQTDCLDETERARAAAFHFPEHANRFRYAHAMRRRILSRYLDLPPETLRFQSNEFGRPQLDRRGQRLGTDLSFNATTTGDLTALAVTAGARIGLDLERARPMPDALDIARTNFHRSEWQDIGAHASKPDRQDAFFRCWTRKEAVVKAEGRGLSMGLDGFMVGSAPRSEAFRVSADGTDWCCLDLSAPPFYAALAISREPSVVRILQA